MLELIFNVLLLLGVIYTMAFHVLEAPVALKVQKNPYALQPNVWPNVILGLLILCIVLNIIQIIRKNRGKEDFSLAALIAGVPGFFKGKVFMGMALVVIMSFILEPLGFMPTCFMLMVAYGLLLGDRKYLRLALVSLLITFVLYVLFSMLLQVNLPRGTIPFLRDFSLFMERLKSLVM